MQVHKNLAKLLITGILPILIPIGTFALSERKATGTSRAPGTKNADLGKFTEEDNSYPFASSAKKFAPEDVAAICFKNGKMILLSLKNEYYAESLPADFVFANMNFFKQFQNLVCLELNGLNLSHEVLENLTKFMPVGLKGLLIQSCTIEDYELLANLIKKCKALSFVNLFLPYLPEEESTRLLAALENQNNLKYLGITFPTISAKGSDHLSKLISIARETLHGVSLAWNKIIGDKENPYKKISNAIAKVKTLKKLEIVFSSLTENDLPYIAEFLKNGEHLSALKMYFNNLIQLNSIKTFECAEALQKALGGLIKLKSFDISSANFPDDMMQLISLSIGSMKKLKTLDVSGNAIGKKIAENLSKSIENINSVITFKANCCSLNQESFTILSKSFSSLKYASFEGNPIKDGISSLPINSMPKILAINLTQTGLTPDLAMKVVEMTKEHPSLKIINFSGNSEIENESGAERTIRNDRLAKWKFQNQKKRQILFTGL